MFPLLSVQAVSDSLFCEPSNNQSTSECVSDGNFSPDGDRSVLNAVLSTHTEHGNGELLLPGIGGSPGKIFNSCQTQGNPFSFSLSFQKVTNNPGNSQHVKSYSYMKVKVMSQKGQKGEPPLFVESMCVHKNGLRELHPEPRLNTSVNQNFVKNKFFNLKSNYDQASQKNFKNSILYGKIIFKYAKDGGTILMSQAKAPFHSYKSSGKNPKPCYQSFLTCFNILQNNFYLGNQMQYGNLDDNLTSSFKFSFPHFPYFGFGFRFHLEGGMSAPFP